MNFRGCCLRYLVILMYFIYTPVTRSLAPTRKLMGCDYRYPMSISNACQARRVAIWHNKLIFNSACLLKQPFIKAWLCSQSMNLVIQNQKLLNLLSYEYQIWCQLKAPHPLELNIEIIFAQVFC